MWLRDATVVERDGSARPGRWVEVVPTGRHQEGHDRPAADAQILDAAGLEIVAAPHDAIADALLAAIVGGDVAAAAALYADDLVVWHNHDGIDRDKAESLELIAAMARTYRALEATDVRRDHLADGYVQRTVFRAVDAAGNDEIVDTMMRVWVADARITRIEEYAVGGAAAEGEGRDGEHRT
ncbi:protein of unknown function [Jatrophihabitans endophyticus]|uniref:DUF4440 domain-containing protein n=1 Tax=Jatrophihabitans endophyticus TaxID=1206085 RepID=A0A1M5PHU9_9ACTN|nr:DUF4440 domain-containing protein [Jatrophihabitans endophyticus]SHH01251.1 protein of unknown function [Jatrophihabitans endophyticus]